jgi:hypothetical protein
VTLAGFGVTSLAGLNPAWAALGGAVVLAARALRQKRTTPDAVLAATSPLFCLFVLALGVVVKGVVDNGLDTALGGLLPGGSSPPALLAVAAVAAALANLINNLPAILAVLPILAAAGPGPVLAALIGVNLGPNLTYVGSLATLLWRRILREHDTEPALGHFTRLGLLTVPTGLAAATVALWAALHTTGADHRSERDHLGHRRHLARLRGRRPRLDIRRRRPHPAPRHRRRRRRRAHGAFAGLLGRHHQPERDRAAAWRPSPRPRPPTCSMPPPAGSAAPPRSDSNATAAPNTRSYGPTCSSAPATATAAASARTAWPRSPASSSTTRPARSCSSGPNPHPASTPSRRHPHALRPETDAHLAIGAPARPAMKAGRCQRVGSNRRRT